MADALETRHFKDGDRIIKQVIATHSRVLIVFNTSKSNMDMPWETQPDSKLKNKSHDENHSPFAFSFHHINTTPSLHR